LPLRNPTIVAHSPAFPGGRYEAVNLLDGCVRTEYSSAGRGIGTFVDFDFGAPVTIAGFKHVDRNDPATVAVAKLVFSADPGFKSPIAAVAIVHANARGATTIASFPSVTARYVRWQVTGLNAKRHGTVGGAEIAFFTAAASDPAPVRDAILIQPAQLVVQDGPRQYQPVAITVAHPYAEPAAAAVCIEGMQPIPIGLKFGSQKVEVRMPVVATSTPIAAVLKVDGKTISRSQTLREPVRHWEIYLLPHSHVDIGYTALQTDVDRKQTANLTQAMELARATANYPQGSRFKWNVEVMWPVENYLRDATPQQRRAFIDAVRSGQVGLEALYGNLLTGLCRPEEQMHMIDYALKTAQLCHVPLQSAMISDVPGYTWSTIATLAHGGVKYFSFGPNYLDRIGATMVVWPDKPFYWLTPDGQQKVLCWCPKSGYALGHLLGDATALPRFVPDYLDELIGKSYPYDVTYLRWNVHGDNGSPDEKLSDVVRQWNAEHLWPKLVIATTATAFAELEKRYGPKLSQLRGDYTPYWEDGAGSSARETGINRTSAERLVQAGALWALLAPQRFPADDFYAAWRNVLLYSEHTWGAHNSITQPDLPFVKDQWAIKQGFAMTAEAQSRQLLAAALQARGEPSENVTAIDVYNTSSWPRTDLVILRKTMQLPGERVEDSAGRAVPSQLSRDGELAFLATDVPALAAKRFVVRPGSAAMGGSARARGNVLSTGRLRLAVDATSGAITSLRSGDLGAELVDARSGTAINDFFYLPGSELKDLQRCSRVRMWLKEPGPLVASLVVESDAPGCLGLRREVRVVDGLDRVDLRNVVDKMAIRAKEGVHFGFGFNVPEGTLRMDVGWAVVRPNVDQLPAACKNWFSVQRWADISNATYGVTWATLDAPLVEVGAIRGNLVGSQPDPKVWLADLPPSQSIYSWVMNNHWHTNYRADQDGPTVFRYAIRPHGGYDAAAAARFGLECSQPLIAVAATGPAAAGPRFTIQSGGAIVAAFVPSEDHKALIVRLFGASGKADRVTFHWAAPVPKTVWLSDVAQRPVGAMAGPVDVPAWGIVTLRADLP
jgi:hypothetical protein